MRHYFRNRALGIFPADVVILLIASYVLRTTYRVSVPRESGAVGIADTLGPLTDPVTLFANLTMLQTHFPSTAITGLGVSWLLTTELCFYLVLPLLAAAGAAAATRTSPAFGACLTPAALLCTGLVSKLVAEGRFTVTQPRDEYYFQWGGNWHAVFERSLAAHADLFAYGAFAAVLVAAAEHSLMPARALVVVQHTCGAVVLGIAMVVAGPGFPGIWGLHRFTTSLFGIACACLIVVVVLPRRSGRPGRCADALESGPVRYLGLVSYGSTCGIRP